MDILVPLTENHEYKRVYARGKSAVRPSLVLYCLRNKKVKQARVERLMELQRRIAGELNRERVGKQMRVIVDGRQGDFYVARSEYDSPEVDQEILIPADEKRLFKGRFYEVKITDAEDYDLYGELVR